MLFTTPEELFFTCYLTGEKYVPSAQEISWEKLLSYYPATYLHSRLHDLPMPPWVQNRLKTLAMECLQKNQKRLSIVRNIALIAQKADIPLLFVKGAAEIADNANNSVYMCSRAMADIDVICHSNHIERLHVLLTAQGNRFYDYGLFDAFHGNMQAMERYLVIKTGHLVYNFDSDTDKIELHINVTNDPDLASYPPNFIDALWKEARSVPLGGVSIEIPLPAHMIVYSLCHAASPKNNIFFPEFPLRQRMQNRHDYIHFILGRDQLKLLCQLHLMLANYTQIDKNTVQALLSTVHNPLLDDYVALASYYLTNFALRQNVTEKMLLSARRRNTHIHLLRQRLRYILIKFLKTVFQGRAHTILNRILLRTLGRFI